MKAVCISARGGVDIPLNAVRTVERVIHTKAGDVVNTRAGEFVTTIDAVALGFVEKDRADFYDALNFRPAIEQKRKTDISVFRRLLKKAKEPA